MARQNGADTIHPGYGFLSERADFARACGDHGITFVGPPAEALALFGDKVRARELAASLAIPIVRGSGSVETADDARLAADHIGYPVMLKAAAGGGGRGIRQALSAEDIAAEFDRCQSEAEASFGDGTIFVERLVARPHHVEVQVLVDSDGGVIHLGDRDCSVQVRNQKVVEKDVVVKNARYLLKSTTPAD